MHQGILILNLAICSPLFSSYLVLLLSSLNIRFPPTRSLGIRRNSAPCFRNTSPAVWAGLMPTPSSVMIALVSGDDLNCSAANLTTAVNGVESGTLKIL